MGRQQRLQTRPLLIRQVMTPKPVIIHNRHPSRSDCLPHRRRIAVSCRHAAVLRQLVF